ncbi:MAG: hypothetical protein ACOX4H_12325 [Bacillota bacterium]|nr:hypothetical protein [Clostridia bacterium]
MRSKTVKNIVLWGAIFIFGIGFGLAYPHMAEMLAQDNEIVEMVGAKGEKIRTECGTYVGQIDNNSIEIKIDGEPKAFQLSDRVKENFAQLGLETDDKVVFSYVPRGNEQMMIIDIKKIEAKS